MAVNEESAISPDCTDAMEDSSPPPLRGGLPLPRMRTPRLSNALYTVRPIDPNSRVQALGVLPVLGWGPGTRLRWQVRAGLIVATRLADDDLATPGDTTAITKSGFLRLPAFSRHAARMRIADRVLLAAGLVPNVLAVMPMATVDQALLPKVTLAMSRVSGEPLS